MSEVRETSATAEFVSRLRVILFTDLAGSVSLKKRLGAAGYSHLIFRHDELFKEIVGSYDDAHINKDTGDGFLVLFERPGDAVEAALRFQHALAVEPWPQEAARVSIGLHAGQVSEVGEEASGQPKLIGLATDMAARIMGLALPGQILMSRAIFDDARQFVRRHPVAGEDDQPLALAWQAHGPYLFKGNEEPVEVFEVGTVGEAPLEPPPDAEKARRSVPAGEEETLGWRPGSGLEIPARSGWRLLEKIGEGSFGEVWVGEHVRTRNRRVFKFCFDADRLRSFKRELTFFRLIREALGDRRDISRLYEVQFDHPPYFLESEYATEGSLEQWAQRQGGIDEVPPALRLDLLARTARAVAAAHSVGVLHKDIKPANLLIFPDEKGRPRPRLADFGVGALADPSQMAERDITFAGFNATLLSAGTAMPTGTPLYTPPEVLAGRRFTVQGDVYALGVLLFQLVVGDLNRPLATGWEQQVDDELLREDIRAAVAGDPEQRLASAAELAERIETLEERRAELGREQRRRRLRRIAGGGVALLAILLVLTVTGFLYERHRREQIAAARDKAQAINRYMQETLGAAEDFGPRATLLQVLDDAELRLDADLADLPEIDAAVRRTLGDTYRRLGRLEEARRLLERSQELVEGVPDADPLERAATLDDLAQLRRDLEDIPGAAELFEESLAIRRRELAPTDIRLADGLVNMAGVHQDRGELEAARRLFREARQIYRDAGARERLSTAINNLGFLEQDAGNLVAAEERFQEALAIEEPQRTADGRLGPVRPSFLETLNNLAAVRVLQGDLTGAGEAFGRLLELAPEVLGENHWRVAQYRVNDAARLRTAGRVEDAETVLRTALASLDTALGPEHPQTLTAHLLLGDCLLSLARPAEAEQHLLTVHRTLRDLPAVDHSPFLHQIHCGALNALVVLNQQQNRPARAGEMQALFDQKCGGG